MKLENKYFLTLIVKDTKENIFFTVCLESEKTYEEGILESALRDIGALSPEDTIISFSWRKMAIVTSADSLIKKYHEKLDKING